MEEGGRREEEAGEEGGRVGEGEGEARKGRRRRRAAEDGRLARGRDVSGVGVESSDEPEQPSVTNPI